MARLHFLQAHAVDFVRALHSARRAMSTRDMLQVDPVHDIEHIRTFWLTKDDKAGFAITNTGVLVHVFKHPQAPYGGILPDVLNWARGFGAIFLEAMDTYLVAAYTKAGATEYARQPFNPEYAPKGWNAEDMGTPDYVYMKL